MNIAEVLRRQATHRPGADAVIDARSSRTRRTTFWELERRSARAATLLRRSGLCRGDAVLVLLPMSAELYVAIATIFRLGLVALFVDPSAGKEHIARCCAVRPPRALMASAAAHLLRLWCPALRRIPISFSFGSWVPGATPFEHASELPPDESIEPCSADTPALLTFTSGSTGRPKGSLRTHGFLLDQHRAIEDSLNLQCGQTELVTLPIFVLANLASGVTSLIPDVDLRRPEAVKPGPVLQQIQVHRPDRAAASPAFFEQLADHCDRHGIILPSLKKLLTGGGPVPPRLIERLARIAPRATVIAVYGSTEAEPIAQLPHTEITPDDACAMLRGAGLLAGRPVPGIELRIIRDRWGTPLGQLTVREFNLLRQPAGAAGEIVVSGDHVSPGYLDGHGDDENKFSVECVRWHRTGDAGYLDRTGRLWLLGRCVARLDDDHGELYPLGVEQAALGHDGVRRAAIVSSDGKRVLAVELRDRLVRADLDALKQSLGFAQLDSVRVVKRLPVDGRHNSKIDYAALQSLLENGA